MDGMNFRWSESLKPRRPAFTGCGRITRSSEKADRQKRRPAGTFLQRSKMGFDPLTKLVFHVHQGRRCTSSA
jgi:hypothetical protein